LAAELLDVPGQAHAVDLEQHLARQRVAVGVQSRGGHGDDHVAGADVLGAEEIVGLDDTDASGGDVVVVGLHQARVLGGLAAEQRTAGLHTAFGDAGDDLGHALGHGAAHGDVVLQEQGFGAAHHEVVDDHRDEVDADGVVLVHGLRDGEFGAHPVGRRGQQWLAVSGFQAEQPGKTSEAAAHFRAGGLLRVGLEQFDGAIACLDVNPRRSVGGANRFSSLILASHRPQGYRSHPRRCTSRPGWRRHQGLTAGIRSGTTQG
jgi:hypothetical protein